MSLETSVESLVEISHKESFCYHTVIASVFRIIGEISKLESTGISREAILPKLMVVRSLMTKSPFFNRLQTWPRGYQGDFETIEYLMQGNNKAPLNTLEYNFERYGLLSPAAQQHRNKISHQANQIRDLTNRQTGGKKKLLSLACGSSPDLIDVYIPQSSDCEFTFFDYDDKALETTKRRVPSHVNSIYIKGNVLKIEKYFGVEDKFNLVLIGGLFDYLSDRAIKKIVRFVCDNLLAFDARLFFTNISTNFPDRIWIEYFTDWIMNYRNAGQIENLIKNIDGITYRIYTETLGITNLVEITKR